MCSLLSGLYRQLIFWAVYVVYFLGGVFIFWEVYVVYFLCGVFIFWVINAVYFLGCIGSLFSG